MFVPDYKNIESAARNLPMARIPLYEHLFSIQFIERLTGEKFGHLLTGDYDDKVAFFKHLCGFQRDMGYDAVSFECCIGEVMPGAGALGGHIKGVLQTREDFEKYPWDTLCDRYFTRNRERFKALRAAMPEGMRAIGGVGNGIFECVQELVGFMDLCYIREDDEDLYRDLFTKLGDVVVEIWTQFLKEFGDIYCVCRFGDDLGFLSATLLHADDVRELIIPQYKRVVELVHQAGKPFLLHSCGNLFRVMDDIISVAGIDAKHSNEDVIAPFDRWIDDYGDRIGNFGGLDTDALCDVTQCDLVPYTTRIYRICEAKGRGTAVGSGNSIPDYVDAERFLEANRTLRSLRGE